MSKNLTSLYSCKAWSTSTNLNALKSWALLLPFSPQYTGLNAKVKRFTLLRSPLGNKTSKEQFERREYRSFIHITSSKPEKILAFLGLLKSSNEIKTRVVVSLK